LRLANSPAPPPLTLSQASLASRRSSVSEEDDDAKGEDEFRETSTPRQRAPASLLSALSGEDEENEGDKDCAETAGGLERAEAGGTELARRAEEGVDVGGKGNARGPAALRLTDVDLRGLEFSEQVEPSLHHLLTDSPPPLRPPTYPTPSLLALRSMGVALIIHFMFLEYTVCVSRVCV
jgi:hypothetical protein